MIKIRVPSSSANLGPGFDVLGLALSLYLELHVTVTSSSSATVALNCEISCEGLGAETIRKGPEENLITQVALYVLRCHGHHEFARHTKVHIINNIPLSRGLGSSGAAVVAGVMLANEVGDLGLTKERILDYCLMVERHPDNITAALYGGFVGACLSELDAEDMARTEIPLSEVLPEPAGGEDTGKTPPIPPLGIGQFEKFSFAPEIKAVVVIPDFKVDTADARKVLPSSYSRSDTVCTLGLLEASETYYPFRSSIRSVSHFLLISWACLRLTLRKYIWQCRIDFTNHIAANLFLDFLKLFDN